MRFVDEAVITVSSGHGGHGCVSFRREKFIPKGGPDGGDGGRGGRVILMADESLLTLQDFRRKRVFRAPNGRPGEGAQRNGRDGEDLIIRLPVGTLVRELYELEGRRGELLADLTEDGQSVVVAEGGRGGKGNTHFKSSTMRTPRFSQPGEDGQEKILGLELRTLADVGLIGLPNAGKSTFISSLTRAKPRIGDYPFTTLSPNLGVLQDDYGTRMVVADIPGLIEGAHAGRGIGIRFLRHVQRTRFLVHILSVEQIDPERPWAGFDLVMAELTRFDPGLAAKPQLKIVNKIDLLAGEELAALQERARLDGLEIYFISAEQRQGLEPVIAAMWALMAETKPENTEEEI